MTGLTSAAVSHANLEPPAAYDARSVGMGSTGVAYAHNGSALYHNPAAMQGIEQGAITLAFSPFLPQLTTPLAGPNTEVKSQRSFFPMFLIGGAYRVNQQLTLGIAAFPTMGLGARYENVAAMGGATLDAKLAAIEVAPGVAYALTDYLALGATYRMTYMSYALETPAPVPTKIDLSGWSFLGVQLGIFARASKTTRLGLTYRNKVPVTMSGKTDMPGQSIDSKLEFAAPHIFKLGVAQGLLDDRLLLALDFKLSLYHESSKELALKTDAGAPMSTQTLAWKNTMGVYAGGEYRLAPEGPAVRLGYGLAQSATPNAYAQPILPPPGLLHSLHAGVGISVSKVDVDLGGYYVFGGREIQPQAPNAPGNYSMNGALFSVSATYRL
jgi:long-chain fatty acid transport protein